jgi:hypothetical protein
MRKSRFSEEHIIGILMRVEAGQPVAAAWRSGRDLEGAGGVDTPARRARPGERVSVGRRNHDRPDHGIGEDQR